MNKIADAITRLASACNAEGIAPPTIVIPDGFQGDRFHAALCQDHHYLVDPHMRDDLGKIWKCARFCGVKVVWPYALMREPATISEMLSSGVD